MQRPRLLAFALAAAGLLASTSLATAQASGPAPPSAAGDSGRRMFDPVGRLLDQRNELKITDEQATRLEAIRAQYLEKNQTRVEDLRRGRQASAALRASMDSTRTEVMAVLTPEQQKQVVEMRKKWRSEWREGKYRGRHEHGHAEEHEHD